MRFTDRVDKFYRYFIGSLLVIITGVLLVMSLVGTSEITAEEYTIYKRDNIFLQLIAIAAVMALAMCFVRFGRMKKLLDSILFPRLVFAAAAIFLLLLIVGTQMSPGSDSGMICAVARRILSNDLSEDLTLDTIQYMQKYPNQNGMVVFIWLLFGFVGTDNYIALQLINLLALAASYYFIYMFVKDIAGLRAANASLIVICLFLPFSIYVMFVYGTMLGMAFAMAACFLMGRFFKSGRMLYGILSGAAIAVAAAFKSNYMIMFVALAITAIVAAIRSRKPGMLIVVAFMCALQLLVGPVTKKMYCAISGDSPSDGIPYLAWVAMGLQESPGRAEGWYNSYNDLVFELSGGDSKAAGAVCRENISQRLSYMLENPAYTVKFFAKKTASQWNNPTFECFTFIQDMRINHHKVMPSLEAVYDDGSAVNGALVFMMNIMQSCILAGAFAYFIINFKKNDAVTLLYGLIFLGGFFFHFVWEAKCQYTVVYILLLIPYAVMGYNSVCTKILKSGRGIT